MCRNFVNNVSYKKTIFLQTLGRLSASMVFTRKFLASGSRCNCWHCCVLSWLQLSLYITKWIKRKSVPYYYMYWELLMESMQLRPRPRRTIRTTWESVICKEVNNKLYGSLGSLSWKKSETKLNIKMNAYFRDPPCYCRWRCERRTLELRLHQEGRSRC